MPKKVSDLQTSPSNLSHDLCIFHSQLAYNQSRARVPRAEVPRARVGWGAAVGLGEGGRGVVGIPSVENEKVPWFQSFRVSKFQWSHITNIPFHVFWQILIPYSRFPKSYQTDLRDFSVPAFSRNFKIVDCQNVQISQNKIFHKGGAAGGYVAMWQIFKVSKFWNVRISKFQISKIPRSQKICIFKTQISIFS